MKPQTLLRILLVLSMINAVYWFLSGAMMALFLPMLENFYAAHPDLLEEFHIKATWEFMVQVPRLYYGAITLLWALSFAGCLLMWKLRRSGFHCYTLAQLLLLAVPPLFLGKGYLGLGDIMFTALFVFCYWRLLKSLGAFSDKSDNSGPSDNSEPLEYSDNSDSSEPAD